ncbi:hypothetical protein VTN00DRAFT_4868 [Thermoascus crustaceus]|uniref:uncharacterized protein n=1 Tax=Thermoascus crustaceus TaxID=5088 RepID=UPI0037420FB3
MGSRMTQAMGYHHDHGAPLARLCWEPRQVLKNRPFLEHETPCRRNGVSRSSVETVELFRPDSVLGPNPGLCATEQLSPSQSLTPQAHLFQTG